MDAIANRIPLLQQKQFRSLSSDESSEWRQISMQKSSGFILLYVAWLFLASDYLWI